MVLSYTLEQKQNKFYVHAVPKLTNKVELRLSLTFRHISTYINEQDEKITGFGELYQSKDYPFTKLYANKFSKEIKLYEDKSFNKLNEWKTYLNNKIKSI